MGVTQLNGADMAILVVVIVSTFVGLFRGFVREAFSLAVWVLAFWVSWTFFHQVSRYLEPVISTPSVRMGLAFAGLMIASLLVGGVVNYLVIRLVQTTGMSSTDRFVGMVFGAARGALLVALFVLLAGFTPLPQDPWWQQSKLLPNFQELAYWMRENLPPEVAAKFQSLGSVK